MENPKIDKNIPLPSTRAAGGGRPAKYPFKQMKVGDSFFIPGKKASDLSSSMSHARRNGINLVCRVAYKGDDIGVRIWRV